MPVVPPTNNRRNRRMHRPSQRRVHREPFSINSEGVLGRAVSAGWLGWLQHTGRGASLRRAPACRQASQPGRPQSRARSPDMSSSVPPTLRPGPPRRSEQKLGPLGKPRRESPTPSSHNRREATARKPHPKQSRPGYHKALPTAFLFVLGFLGLRPLPFVLLPTLKICGQAPP